jgi:ATP-dependent phosphofructokinase / diphosphate-dependent phosphofructokinase
VLGTRFGVHAADLAFEGGWGRMVSLRGTEIGTVALADAVRKLKRLDPAIWDIVKVFT